MDIFLVSTIQLFWSRFNYPDNKLYGSWLVWFFFLKHYSLASCSPSVTLVKEWPWWFLLKFIKSVGVDFTVLKLRATICSIVWNILVRTLLTKYNPYSLSLKLQTIHGSLCSPNEMWEAFPNIVLCLFRKRGFLMGFFPLLSDGLHIIFILFYTWLVKKSWALWKGSQVELTGSKKWPFAFTVCVYWLGTTSWKFPISACLLAYALNLLKKIEIKLPCAVLFS